VRLGRGGAALGGGVPGGGASADGYDWPALLPAFRSGGARVDLQGRLWVERYGRADAPVVYDVFGSDGVPIEQVRLPPGRRIIGFGRDATYAVHVDDVGLHWIEVYR
jgi:hypothetical protein